MITAKCYGGPLDGEWITAERRVVEVPQSPSMVEVWSLESGDPLPIRTATYVAKWIRPRGWRIAFPVFVLGPLAGAGVAQQISDTYRARDHWPIEMGRHLR